MITVPNTRERPYLGSKPLAGWDSLVTLPLNPHSSQLRSVVKIGCGRKHHSGRDPVLFFNRVRFSRRNFGGAASPEEIQMVNLLE
nr:hypothetical protein CFP56_58127 [Quercus suber]